MNPAPKDANRLVEAQKVVCVFGSNDARKGDETYELARSTGAVLAGLGYTVANGGYGGTMEASAAGAKQAGGRTIGVTCSLWRSRPNRHIDQVIVTDSLFARLERLLEVGTAGYVLLPGATGTLVELAAAWETMGKGLLAARPLVCMGQFWRPVIELMVAKRAECGELVAVADSPQELARYFPPTGRVSERFQDDRD
jgi:hypothetical protein